MATRYMEAIHTSHFWGAISWNRLYTILHAHIHASHTSDFALVESILGQNKFYIYKSEYERFADEKILDQRGNQNRIFCSIFLVSKSIE